MDYVALGKKIRNRRREMRMTQESLAEAAGISLSFLGHIERGSRKSSMDTFVNITNVLNVSPEYLLRDSLKLKDPNHPGADPQIEAVNEITRVIMDNLHYLKPR